MRVQSALGTHRLLGGADRVLGTHRLLGGADRVLVMKPLYSCLRLRLGRSLGREVLKSEPARPPAYEGGG